MRVVVVTGASAGVGRAAAEAFAARGDAVAFLAQEPGRLQTALAEVEAAGGRGMTVPVDVADAAAVVQAACRVEEQLGPIDVWVNNAMVSVIAPFEHVTPDE